MKFSNTYILLGESFYQKSQPTAVAAPELFLWNDDLAQQLQIPAQMQEDTQRLAEIFSGNVLLEGSEPIACAYSGHQFGQFNPQLGDGRAHLLGEVIDVDGQRVDVQLKGSGRSAFSRNGDGRCALKPAVREFIMSEAVKALGVPTTQCLAVVTTGEKILRQYAQPGAVVTRIASSHIRVGTFAFFAARGDTESLQALCEYTIDKHYPEIRTLSGNPLVLLLDKVIEKQIELIVQWMRVGFIHGVMNTDNCAISGETIDFGPCAMMGVYDPATVYSSIDHQGRYAFGNQAQITHWNICRFTECLLALIDQEDTGLMDQINDLISGFTERFEQAHHSMMAKKLGFLKQDAGDDEFISALLKQLTKQKMDYTISFDLLTRSLSCDAAAATLAKQLGELFTQWQKRVKQQDVSLGQIQSLMRLSNPVVIPRNHHIEAVLKACEESGQPTAALAILDVLRQPYVETEKTAFYQTVAVDGDENYQTFCGT
ncbi:MAG: YdiU family protein [Pseudomonadales bacterium]|nr:YdiU family protein [Pseudomonadales bacterium]